MQIVLIAVTALIILAHPRWLRFLGQTLIVEAIADTEDADFLMLLDGDHCFDFASKSLQRCPSQNVLLQQVAPRRLQYVGVLGNWEKIAREQLVSRGIPLSRIELLPGQTSNRWQAARVLNRWIRDRPNSRVAVLCDRFSSGPQAEIYNIVMDADIRDRLLIVALPDRRYDETNWWRSAVGIKAFFGAGFSGFMIATRGEEDSRPVDWDPDKYEASLVKHILNEQ